MKKIIPFTLFIIFLMSACQAFLGPGPDNSPKEIFDKIWTDFDKNYALFNERLENKTWKEIRDIYSPRISPGMGNYELFRVCSDMVNELKDPHALLITPFGDSDAIFDNINRKKLFNLDSIQDVLNDKGTLTDDKMFLYGTFAEKPNAGYIYIKSFKNNSGVGPDLTQDWVKKIDGIVKKLQKNTDFIVLDIRNNSGGSIFNMHHIAGYFVSTEKDYIKVSTKNGPGYNDFSPPLPFTIKPADTQYTKPIVLLTSTQTISAAEWFTLALRTQKHVIHAGETTCGAFSARVDHPIINGWYYTLSVQKVTNINGVCLEGTGITPHEGHRITHNEQNYGWDRQLQYAINLFNMAPGE